MIKEVIIQQQGQNEVVCFPHTAPPKKPKNKQNFLITVNQLPGASWVRLINLSSPLTQGNIQENHICLNISNHFPSPDQQLPWPKSFSLLIWVTNIPLHGFMVSIITLSSADFSTGARPILLKHKSDPVTHSFVQNHPTSHTPRSKSQSPYGGPWGTKLPFSPLPICISLLSPASQLNDTSLRHSINTPGLLHLKTLVLVVLSAWNVLPRSPHKLTLHLLVFAPTSSYHWGFST